MESYWITNSADRHDLLRAEWVSVTHADNSNSWQQAEHTLRCSWDRFSTFGSTGVLYRDAVIKPLHDRFNAGERSFALLCEILSL
jgi:hypothetical protein